MRTSEAPANGNGASAPLYFWPAAQAMAMTQIAQSQMRLMLAAQRAMFDATRAAVRVQQDALLALGGAAPSLVSAVADIDEAGAALVDAQSAAMEALRKTA